MRASGGDRTCFAETATEGGSEPGLRGTIRHLRSGWYHQGMRGSIKPRGPTNPRRQAPERPTASGTFVLRLDPRLHDLLRRDASAAGTSLNEWCGRLLAAPAAGGLDWSDVVLAIRSRLGDDLAGVVVYGSFARGESGDRSDVDLLVVLGTGKPITRALYREWEGVLGKWRDREIDLHFVPLPAPDHRVSATWAEAAVCGIVLYDRGLAVSRRLIRIRERIAAGLLLRGQAQGQPYWIDEGADAQP